MSALLDPRLEVLFAPPSRLIASSTWYSHYPFARWLIQALRPRLLVELGTGAGTAYCGFCEAVLGGELATACFGIEGTSADPASETDFRPFHDGRFGAFSQVLRTSFDEALTTFADGSIDLLHLHTGTSAEDDARNYRLWAPKLSPHAVVLMHDINRPAGGGARSGDRWRFWSGLSATHPAFAFFQGAGLGVIAPGQVPPVLHQLLAPDLPAAEAARLRERFGFLGVRWQAEAERLQMIPLQALLAEQSHEISHLRQAGADQTRTIDALQRTLDGLRHERDRLRDDIADTKAERHRLAGELTLHRRRAVTDEDRRVQADAALRAVLDEQTTLRQRLDEERLTRAEADRIAAEARRAVEAAERAAAWQQQHAEQASETAEVEHRALRQAIVRLENEHAALLGSASWRMTAPARTVLGMLRRMVHASTPAPADIAKLPETLPASREAWLPVIAPPLPAADTPIVAPAAAEAATVEQVNTEPQPTTLAPVPDHQSGATWRIIRRILFVAGEPGTPGAIYRTQRAAAACAALGYETETVDLFDVNPDNLAAADLVVLWRAAYSGHIHSMLRLAHEAGTRVAFDVDDLIVKPSLATIEVIDGIRTNFVTEAEGRSHFRGMQHTLLSCDLATTTTLELAQQVGEQHSLVHVLPNGFDAATERASRYAVRLRDEHASDQRVRLGYAGGTRTHQKDFATIAGALARVLEQRPETLLVLFRDGLSGEGLVLIEEFPELLPFAGRIEWRDRVALADLPAELARFDVSLCPLEQDNPFCEAKSELKYFESALANVCVVASPTGPFRRAIKDGVTGLLPADATAWEHSLLRLVDDPALRRRLARSAYHHVLWQFGPRRQAELWAGLLTGLNGGPEGARASELALRRGAFASHELPVIPDSELLFSYDALGAAEVTVGITSYNYEIHLGEALESVAAQTLEAIDLVVVDDGSTDESVAVLLDWAARNRKRFNRVRILRTVENAGLGGARNVMFDAAETPHIMVLDADNRLLPDTCERLLAALDRQPLAAFAYPLIRQFGARTELMGGEPFDPFRLAAGNYIDAMALVAKWAWAAAGGCYVERDAMGWEDFDLWCRLAELGQFGIKVGEAVAEYRVHDGSMTNSSTEQAAFKQRIVSFVQGRHPWLRLRVPHAVLRR